MTMKLVRFALLIVAVSPLAARARADDATTKGDLARFQGTWKTSFGPDNSITLTLKIKDNTVNVSGTAPGGDTFEIKGELKLDEKAKPHKTLDWVKFVGPDGNDLPDNLSIYQVEDADTIKVCNGGPGKDRPTEFKAGDDGHPNLMILKRDKN